MGDVTSSLGEAVVLLRTAPIADNTRGEAVCIAALDRSFRWVMVHPITFRHIDHGRKFARWDRIRFRWQFRPMGADPGRVEKETIEICGQLPLPEREALLEKCTTASLRQAAANGQGLALVQPKIVGFDCVPVSAGDLARRRERVSRMRAQMDAFGAGALVPLEPCPYDFKFRIRDEDGEHALACSDWELEATFTRWRKLYGEKVAVDAMVSRFGRDYAEKGMVLAVGRHPADPGEWVVNGIIRLDEVRRPGASAPVRQAYG